MARRGALAIQRQLRRELQHRHWLHHHLPHSAQLRACQRRILVLRTELALITQSAVPQ